MAAVSSKCAFTINALPQDHQARQAQEDEDAPDHGLPLVALLTHLWVGLAERQPVHWRERQRRMKCAIEYANAFPSYFLERSERWWRLIVEPGAAGVIICM